METYEDGMAVFYDCVTKAVFINFRGEVHYLMGPYVNKAQARLAGENRCRELGWMSKQLRAA